MLKVAREVVKKYGKENVTLIQGGRPEKSIIDKNIIRLGEGTGLKVVSDALDRSKPNAANIRTQKRIDDTSLIQYSFNSKGDLNLKDKYEGYWRDYYEKLGKQTIGKGDVRPEGSLRFPKKKYKKDAQGKPTKDLQSRSTLETTKFKTLLDKVEDDTNLQRQFSGVEFAKKKDAWTKENIGFNLITEKNIGRIDFIESGEGLSSFKREYKSLDDYESQTYVEDTSVIGREGDQRQDVGRRGGAQVIKNIVTGKTIENTNIYRVRGTLLTGSALAKDTGDMTDIQIAKKNPYPQSSMSQLVGDVEYDDYKGQGREIERKVELKDNLKQLTDQTDITEEGIGEDKKKSGKGIERHKVSHILREQPIKDRVEIKRILRKYAPVFKRLVEVEKKVKTGSNKTRIIKNLKRLDNVARNLAKQIPDRLAFDAAQVSDTSSIPVRSVTVESEGLKNVAVPSPTKADKIKLTRAKIAKGPLGGRKAKGTGWWEGTTRRITPIGLGAFSLFSTILAPIRARKEARKDLGREPTTMESLNYVLPKYARKKRPRYNAPI